MSVFPWRPEVPPARPEDVEPPPARADHAAWPAAAEPPDEGVREADPEELRLVRAARAGDRAAFGLLYERHARMVHGISLARGGRQDAADLVQEVFIKALERLSTLRDDAAFAPWLCALARNHTLDFLRRRRHVEELPDDLAAPDRPVSDAEAVLAVIRRLPEAYRETLVLRLVEGMTGPEISRKTGLTPGSVRVNLHRGFKLLRDALSR